MELSNHTEECVAKKLYDNKSKGKDKQTKKSMAKDMGLQYQYFTNLSRKACVLDRVNELAIEDDSKDKMDKDGRIKLLTDKINSCTDSDTLVKLIALLDKIDDRESAVDRANEQIVIVKLPDNNRSK